MTDVKIEMKGLVEKMGEAKQSVDGIVTDIKDMKSAIKDLQIKAGKGRFSASGVKEISPEMKGMIENISGLESKTATVANGPSGGYFAIPEFIANVIPKIYDNFPLLEEITTYNVDGNVATIPVETGEPDVTWVGEIETVPESDIGLGIVNIPVNTLSCGVGLSRTIMRNSNLINAETYLIDRTTKAMRRGLGRAILEGTGFKQPEGILSSKKVKTVKSGASKGITTDALFDVVGNFPSELDSPKWLMSKATFMEIAKQFGKDSSYVTMPLGNAIPPAILGDPVIFADMDGLATDGNKAIVYGDFKSGYLGLQGTQMEYIPDQTTKARQGIVQMTYFMPFGGQVIMPEAFETITVGA